MRHNGTQEEMFPIWNFKMKMEVLASEVDKVEKERKEERNR